MSNSKLFELLAELKRSDIKDLEFFIKMPGNQLSDFEIDIALFIFKDLSNRRKVNEQKVFNRFFNPKEDTERVKWNRTKNCLLKVLKRYISMKLVEQSNVNNLLLLRHFKQNGLKKNKSSLFKKAHHKIVTSKDSDKYLYKYLLLELSDNEQIHKRKEDKTFDQMETALDLFYFEKKWRIICEQFNRNEIINSPINDYHLLFEHLEQNSDQIQSKKISIYQHFLQMRSSQNKEKEYLAIRKLIRTSVKELDHTFITEVFEQLMNFAIRALNKGHIQYAHHYLEYMDELLKTKYLPKRTTISHARFKNCITASLILGKTKWAKDFLNTYLDRLDKKIREGARIFNKANIEFHEEDYDACSSTLINFKPLDIYYMLAYKNLYMKLCCEELLKRPNNYNEFNVAIETQKKYIQNKRQLKPEKKKQLMLVFKVIKNVANQKPVDINQLKGHLPILDILWVAKKQKQVLDM